MTELPFHLLAGHKTILEKAIQISLGNSDTKSVDYRKALLTITAFCRSKIDPFAQELLETLVEIQMLAYIGENKRTPKSIFRFLNQSYLHFNLCRIVLGKNLKNISRRKLYGSNFHALIPHGGHQLRIISGMSAFGEAEERLFRKTKSITKTTSNNHPDYVIGNISIRSQVENDFK